MSGRRRMKMKPEQVKVSTTAYEAKHGKKPRGRGVWYFKLSADITDTYGSSSMYSDAKELVRKIAASRSIPIIKLMPESFKTAE